MKKVKLEIEVEVESNMNWIATDECGSVVAYENKPVPIDHYDEDEGGWVADGDFDFVINIGKTENWKDTLVKI